MADDTTPRKTAKKATRKTAKRPAAKNTPTRIEPRNPSQGMLSSAKDYAVAGKDSSSRALRSAATSTKRYGKAIASEIKKNPKVASAVVAGLVSVGAALLVRKINHQNHPKNIGEDLVDKAHKAAASITTQAAELSKTITSHFKK